MKDVREIFEVNKGVRVILHLLGERPHIQGEVEEAFENYVSIKINEGQKFCVLYQGIVSVQLRADTEESRSTFSR